MLVLATIRYSNSLAIHFSSMVHAKCLLPWLDRLLLVRSCLQNFYQCWQIMSGFRKDYFLCNCDHLNQESTVYCLRQFWKSWKIGVDPFSVYCFSAVLARLLAIIARLIGQAYSPAVYINFLKVSSYHLFDELKAVASWIT